MGNIRLTYEENDVKEIRFDFDDKTLKEALNDLVVEPIKENYEDISVVDLDDNSFILKCPVNGDSVLLSIHRNMYALTYLLKNAPKDGTEETFENIFQIISKNIDGKSVKEINDMITEL